MTCSTPDITIRELDRRSNHGIEVRLTSSSVTNEVMVAAHDSRTERGPA